MSNITVQNNQLSLIPAPQEFQTMKELSAMAFKSGLLPSGIKSAEAAMIIMLKGRELGIPAMQAFSHIHIINGKPTMSAELMLTQIYKCLPKAIINFVISDDKICKIEAQRPCGNKTEWSFTIDEAKKAELLSKEPWRKYTSAMLRARAITIMARAIFPDCLNGVSYTAEELGADIDLDDQGNEVIKDVSPKKVEADKPRVVETDKISKVITNEEASNIKDIEKENSHIINTNTDIEKLKSAKQAKEQAEMKAKTETKHKDYMFKSGAFVNKTFVEIEPDILDAYMAKIAYSVINQEPNQPTKELLEAYEAYKKQRGY
jgi:hypothetical protein